MASIKSSVAACFISALLAAVSADAATLTVNSDADAGGSCPGVSCTLRQAIATAASGDTINFAAGIATIDLASGELLINESLTINGPGANLLTVQRSGTSAFRIFEIGSSANVSIFGLTIANGNAGSGSGIFNGGTLTITNTTISGNSVTATGSSGGGIFNTGFGRVNLVNSTISGNSVTGSGSQGGGIFNTSGGTVSLTNSTISGNAADSAGGGISNNSGGTVILISSTISGNSSFHGGGISNLGALTSSNSTISGNAVTGSGSSGGVGGGIYIFGGTATMTNSTISGNMASAGGGIYSSGTATIINSTLSSNSASGGGGGIEIFGGTATITNSTFFGNSAGLAGGGIYAGGTVTITNSTISGNSGGNGGGIFRDAATINARNTIIAKNTATTGPDFSGTLNSQGFNLIGSNSGTTITPTAGDQIGTVASPIDPMLGPLQDNGGPTKTQALLSGSTAIERGHSSGSNTDQRGFARPVDDPAIANATGGDGSDIGAYEVQADQLPGCKNINTLVSNNNDSGTASLRAVIANVCAGSTITFAANVRGAINLTSGELLINKGLTISGPGANLLTVQRSATGGTAAFRIFHIASNANAAISGLTISNGSAPGNFGGGIFNEGSTVAVINDTISGNAAASGGGLYNGSGGTATITNSTVSGNSGNGGGIDNDNGTVAITNSTISDNSAQFFGGGIYNFSTMTIISSTIAGNTAGISGGGGISNGNGTVNVRNTLIALNTSASGPDAKGALTSQGFNLIGNSSGATIAPVQFSDQIGTAGSPIDPLLGPLQDNGGATFTRALLSGSTAIDQGDSLGLTTDQRGFTRPLGNANVVGGDGADIGAFEVQAPAAVVEFYNASLDHYFITWLVDEIAKLDAGTVIKGWTRTGQSFKTYTTPQPGTSPVCRYYIPPGLGDSHFFGRGTAECDATGQKNPSFVLEDPAFMQMFLPVAGDCPANTTQVYRVFSNRSDANHRYMIDNVIRDQMVAIGWLAEGDGPDLVVMCAPQ